MNEQSECHFLYWETEKGKRYFAGVAFRNEKYGEYFLKIDCHPLRKIYLKDSESKDENIQFRVEESKETVSNRTIRNAIGYGETGKKNQEEIDIFMVPHMDIKLVLTFRDKE